MSLKKTVKKVSSFVFDKKTRFNKMARMGFYNNMEDSKYLKKKYLIMTGKELALENPKTFNEKMQWLKIHDRKDIYTVMADKFEAKEYMAKIIGEKYIIPTLGVYENFDEIDFDKLPLKCTHDSGGLIVCEDKDKLDKAAARKKINKALKRNYYYSGREWPYKDVKPRIISEELMANENGSELVEYNFFCFNGEPRIVMTCHGDKRIKRYNDYYDIKFKKLPFGCCYGHTDLIEKKPKQFAEMMKISKKLSKDIPVLRVDFYLVNDEVKMGELTFFHWSGFGEFSPAKWDRILGDMVDLRRGSK